MEDGRQFVPMYFDFVESKAFSNISGNALKLYLRMRRYVCRARSGHSLSDFYLKGTLAMSGYLEQYANIFDVSKSTIFRWLSELEDAKFIITYRKAEKGRYEPNIWLLGAVYHHEGSQYGTEAFFADHDAMAQEQDTRVPETFDTTRGEIMLASMRASSLVAPLTVPSTVPSTVPKIERFVEQLAEPSNREDPIEKSNREVNIPPSAETLVTETPEDKAKTRIHSALDGYFARNQGAPAMSVPAAAGGADDWELAVDAFAAVTGAAPPTGKVRGQWARVFEKVGTQWEAGPSVVASVIRKKPDSEIGWKSWTTPHAVKEDLAFLLGQHLNGGIQSTKKQEQRQWTTV